jgi:hypothetical protein
MPKTITDYNKTLIYKIVSKNLNITDCYVGNTINFRQRKSLHKSRCYNKNCKSFNSNIYKFIRQNEGWSNWEMIEIEKYPCSDKREAEARERTHYELLNSSLNSYKPFTTDDEKKEYYKNKSKNYYVNNKNNVLKRSKQYYENNKEYCKEYRKEYYKDNKEKTKQYYENNKEKIKQYYKNNKEKIKSYQNEYYKTNKNEIAKKKKKIYYQKNKDKTICDCVE